MDIALFKTSLAGLLGQMYQINPTTGLPTSVHIRANAQAPMSLAETDFPTWILFTGQAVYPALPDQTENRLAKETRDFTCSLYVGIAQAGLDGEAERKVQPYIDPSRNWIQKHIRLWDGNILHEVPGVQRAWLIRDTGVAVLRYGNNNPVSYLGCSFVVRVDVWNEVIYANQ